MPLCFLDADSDPVAQTIPPSLTALGRRVLPERIDVNGRTYDRRTVFKNDFFAVTALYEGEAGKVILKVHRQASFLLVPLRWVGRLLAARESACLERLRGVEGIPSLLGRWGPTGIVREFIEGHPLHRGERVADDFHARLRALVEAMHARGLAYVDLEKAENVLVGDDGLPYLFDFQIAWNWPASWGGELWPVRRLRAWFQRGDLYHLGKLHRRTRPDQLSGEALAATYRRPRFVRVYRFLTWPFLWLRRRALDRVAPRETGAERGRIVP